MLQNYGFIQSGLIKIYFTFASNFGLSMKNCLLFLFISISAMLHAQPLTVLNKSNLQPIENVAIFNLDHTKTALTNNAGIAELTNFTQEDTLFFQHPSYQEFIIPFSVIAELNYQVTLTQSTVNLSEYVVSASKWEQKKDEVPNKITRIKSKDVAYLNPQTSADLLGSSHEVFIQKSQLGGGSPIIRGFSANSVLIVVDGIRMNNAIYRSGNLQNVISVDPNAIEEAEVIYGPGSIIYGSDALGGVMDFHTRKINLTDGDKSLVHGQAMMRYSSANNERTAHADFSFSRKKWGSFTSFSYSDFGDLKMGSIGNEAYQRLHHVEQQDGQDKMISNTEPNIQKYSGYSQLNISQKFLYNISDAISLDYGFHLANTSNIPRYDRLIEYDADSTLVNAEWYYGPQFWMLNSLGMNLNRKNSLYDAARLALGYQYVKESRHDRKFSREKLRSRNEQVDLLSLNFDLDKRLSEKSSVFYGIEGIYNDVGSEAQSKNIITGETDPESTRYPDGGSDYITAAAYVNFKSNIHKKLTIQTGLRYSYVYALSKFVDTSFYTFPYSEIQLTTGALNGSAGLVFRTTESSRVNLNLSSGFRAPNIDDLAKVFDSEPGNVVVPNDNLEPEYAYNVDLGLIKNFGPHVKAEVTGFYTYISNLMIRQDYQFNGQDSILYDGEMSKVQALQNTGSGWVTGISIDLRADITERIGFRTSFVYIRGEDDEGEAIRHVTPPFGSTGFSYAAKKIKVDIWADYSGSVNFENLAPSERSKPHIYLSDANGNPYSPAWYTINLKGYYQVNQRLQVNAGVDNILDHRFRPYSSGIVAPGRNFVVALRANF